MMTLKDLVTEVFDLYLKSLSQRAGREFSTLQKGIAKQHFLASYGGILESVADEEVEAEIKEQLFEIRKREEIVEEIIRRNASKLVILGQQYPFEIVLAKLAVGPALSVIASVRELQLIQESKEAFDIREKIPPKFFGNFSLN